MAENILRGEKLDISLDSLGIQLYNSLVQNTQATMMFDGFSNETRSNDQLLFSSCRLADSMKNYGLHVNDVIGVFSENCLEFIESVLAASYLGITVTTFSCLYTVDELKHTCNLSKPKLLFCSKDTVTTAITASAHLSTVPKIIVINSCDDHKGCSSLNNFVTSYITHNFNIITFKPIQVDVKDHVAFILYSSGTTGLAKGVMLTDYNFNSVFSMAESSNYGLTKEATIGFLPFSHAYGLFLHLLRIIGVSKLIVLKRFDPHLFLKAIQDNKITYLQIVPSIAYFLAKSELVDQYDLSSVTIISCGGAPLSKSIEETLVKRLKVSNIKQGYGMTEATLGISVHTIDKYCYGSCGSVVPNAEVKIIDIDTGRALEPMKTGELCCRGPFVMKGYIGDSESTKNTIDSDGWLHTGDIAYYDNDGAFYFVDRLKELIKYKGLQVAPAELEAILVTHPHILDAGVIGIPDERAGELPYAFVVKNPNSRLSESEIKEFINRQVANYKQLRGGVQFVQEIPRNPSGKILRRILRQLAVNLKSKL